MKKLTQKSYIRVFLILLSSALFNSGCSIYFTKSKSVDEQEDKNSIFVFGYLDDSEAPFKMKWGELRQARPMTQKPIHELRSNREGVFYLENLPPGSYRLDSLGGPDRNILLDRAWTWNFATSAADPNFKRTEFTAPEAGIYFVGAYKIALIKKGFLFRPNRYDTIPINSPSEKQILTQLIEHVEGTKWEGIIKKRIATLK